MKKPDKNSNSAKSEKDDRKLLKTTTMLRYNFSKEELSDKAQLLAEATQKIASIEAELAQIKSDYKKQIQQKQSEISELSTHLTSKYEMRNIPCFLYKNFKMKERQYINHNSEILKIEPLTPGDHQLAIDEVHHERKKESDKKKR